MSASIFPDLQPGHQVSFTTEITEERSQRFAQFTNAAEQAIDSQQIAPQYHLLVISMIGNWLHYIIPASDAKCLNIHFEFLSQINLNDHIDTMIELLEMDDQKHLVTLRINCYNQIKTQVITGQAVMLVHK